MITAIRNHLTISSAIACTVLTYEDSSMSTKRLFGPNALTRNGERAVLVED